MAQLHAHEAHRRTTLNRLHFLFYSCALTAHFHRHIAAIFSASPSALLLLADFTFTFIWLLKQGFRWRPLLRHDFSSLVTMHGLPALDVFICTADPVKEPPVSVACTALSAMAFDYLAERLSVYVSDDGGSELTLFAFMEAAKFARYWLPFCREKGVMERSPEAFFQSCNGAGEAEKLKMMFETLKERVDRATKTGHVDLNLVQTSEEKEVFIKWKNYNSRNHPSIIQVLCESSKDKDITGHPLPNLIYLSREKRPASPHHFKAGALNALLRVSAAMTDAPVLLTLDCDMVSNDPIAPRRALCYFLDPELAPNLAFVQFPQRYRGLNADDIYGGEITWLIRVAGRGFDGLRGPSYAGSGCFFSRRSFYGPPQEATADLSKYQSHAFNSLKSELVLEKALEAASCKYEYVNDWGYQIGFRYGSLNEDINTGYHMHCKGWRSVFCDPDRPAFLGHAPKALHDTLSQSRRWVVGLYEFGFNRYCPLFYGTIKASLLMGLCYMHYALWGALFFPLTVYGLLPQLALFYDKPLFPKASDPWIFLYAYLLLAVYAQEFVEFMELGSSFSRWWNDQRMWMIKGITSFPFGTLDFVLKQVGIATSGFDLTSKVNEEEQVKLYDNGVFFFGMTSPLFISMGTIAIVNLISFGFGVMKATRRDCGVDEMFLQLLLCGFIVANSLPIYHAMFIRKDCGKMPRKVVITSILFACMFLSVGKVII